jgi:hypothetical protein
MSTAEGRVNAPTATANETGSSHEDRNRGCQRWRRKAILDHLIYRARIVPQLPPAEDQKQSHEKETGDENDHIVEVVCHNATVAPCCLVVASVNRRMIQTRHSRHNIQASRSAPPNAKRFRVRRIVGAGNLWATEFILANDGRPAYPVSVMELRDGKAPRETRSFADPSEPGPSRARSVERTRRNRRAGGAPAAAEACRAARRYR